MDISYFISASDPTGTPDAWYWERIRNWRDQELLNTDWTQLADSQVDKVKWATYRQALRDLPKQNVKPRLIVIPVRP